MPHTPGFFKHLWHSVKNQIVQPVPPDLQFCEFHCPYKQCKLAVTGSCEFLPIQALVLIQPAHALTGPRWIMTTTNDAVIASVTVH